MARPECKGFGKADEVREFPLGHVELVNVGGVLIGRATFNPGWRWSKSVKPLVGTEFDVRAGDVASIPPGHDAWVVGSEPVVAVDFQGMADYARKKG